MRRVLAIAFALALFAMVGTGAALANHKDNDNACPPNSPAGSQDSEATPPCGEGEGKGPGNGNGNGGNGGNGGGVEPPEGNCKNADAVLLGDEAQIICLYGPGKGELATEDEECPDALIATGPGPAPLDGGLCVFLPPEEA